MAVAALLNRSAAWEHEEIASMELKDSTALCSMQSSLGQRSHGMRENEELLQVHVRASRAVKRGGM